MDMSAFIGGGRPPDIDRASRDPDRIYTNNIMERMLNIMASRITENDLQNFKQVLDNHERIQELVSDIRYGYRATTLNIFKSDTSEDIWQINPSTLMRSIGMRGMNNMMGMDIWQEMLGDQDILRAQFDVIAGKFPENYNEVVLVVSEHNEITDFALYSLGLRDIEPLAEAMGSMAGGSDERIVLSEEQAVFTYDEILDLTFKLVPDSAFFEKDGDTWVNQRDNNIYMKQVVDEAEEIKVVGILRVKENSAATMGANSGYIGYTTNLLLHLVSKVNTSEAVQEQRANPDTDIFTGLPFDAGEADPENFDFSALPEDQQAYLATLGEEERAAVIANYIESSNTDATFDGNLRRLGASDLSNPTSISIFPKDFASKDELISIIDEYNQRMTDEGNEQYVIHYTDFVGLMMSSVSNIINTISLVLIAFVAISLVVSSIMIGIITYISVLERTKEIGILRSIGASKRDISRVFNAETLIIGFVAGAIGVGITALLCIPANIIIQHVTGISGVAVLPVLGGIILIVVSMALTFIAGLIPSKIAAKKDPVVALRTE